MRHENAQVTELVIPPHNVEAEQAILGGLLLDNSGWDVVSEIVSEGDFYRDNHREIFAVITTQADKGQPFDVVTVDDAMEDNVLPYLGEIAQNTPSSANVETYAKMVREYRVRRHMMQAGEKMRSLAMLPGGISVGSALDQAEKAVLEVARGHKSAAMPTLNQTLVEVVDNIDRMFESGSHLIGLPTGFPDLDKQTAGLQAGNLVILGGRPSMGKTALAMRIAAHLALRTEHAVGVFSLEMTRQELVMRLFASEGCIDFGRLRTGKLRDDEWASLTSVVSPMADANERLHIDDSPALSVREIRSRARRMKQSHDIDLLIVDHIHLMRGNGDNRNLEVSDISRGLKALAKELGIPIIAIAQLNRGPENRDNKRPNMADLRDSGGIEQDADVVAFVYRDEVYDPDTPDKGTAELILAKQRNGPICTVRMAFHGAFTRFDSLAREGVVGGEARATPL